MINDNFNVLCLLPILIIILIILYFILNGSRKRQIQKHQILEAISLAGIPMILVRISSTQKRRLAKDYGFSSIYDEAAAPLSMIIDSNRYASVTEAEMAHRAVEGQYGMVTGGEIGIYTKSDPDPEIPGFADVTFYDCADEEDQLYMAFLLRKRPPSIQPGRKHWWLTGFVLGEFSNPEELQMEISITLKPKCVALLLMRCCKWDIPSAI